MRVRIAATIAVLILGAVHSASAQGIWSAQCHFQVLDAYNQPASGVEVTLDLEVPLNPDDPPEQDTTGYTDSTGWAHVYIYTWYGSYKRATCIASPGSAGYTLYYGNTYITGASDGVVLNGNIVVIPRPTSYGLAGGGTADFYPSGAYDKPVVVAQPFNSAETLTGPMSPADLWKQYNGNPGMLSGGMLVRLAAQGYDVVLVRARLVGDDIALQGADFARAINFAHTYNGYSGNVTVAGYSMGGLVVRTAMAKWPTYGFGSSPPVNLIAALDSPLRGALLSNDAQHAFWNTSLDNGKTAHEHNMDSCSAQQMLENACHKTLNCDDCLECNDKGWISTFVSGQPFDFCNPYLGSCGYGGAGYKSCSGLALFSLGWPSGVRRIAASLGQIGARTNVCYGDSTGLDLTGEGRDGCPAVDYSTFDTGTEWGYIDIRLSTDREFYYRQLNSSSVGGTHWIDELTPGSRQPGSVEDVAASFWIFKTANGHQWLHMGTFIPLYSALDQDPSTGVSSMDEYWTNSYSAFHDALSDRAGTWVNQRTGTSGSSSLVDWLIRNIGDAFGGSSGGQSHAACGESTCVPMQGMYISHFSAPGCGGTESYYLPYDGYGYNCRTWDGGGQCGTVHRTQTNYSYRMNGGQCIDQWPSGNPLNDFVTVYRGTTTQDGCGESTCAPIQGMYISHFSAPGCGGTESYYLPYDGNGYNCRTWNGSGQCGTIHRTMTNYSYRMNGGQCIDQWPSGNQLNDFVTVYRP
jgi:hypothetical protein